MSCAREAARVMLESRRRYWMRTALLLVASLGAERLLAAPLQESFRHPPEEARVMVRWWWFGPAVTKAGLEREIKLMKQGGFGGFEVQPVYPLTLDDPARGLVNLRYLSPEFLEMVRFTADTAHRLGLRMDMTLGSGWPFGGPHIPVELAAGRLRVDRRTVQGSTTSLALPALNPGERLVAAFLAPAEASAPLPERVSPLAVVDDGGPRLLLPASAGPRSVLLFIASHTGQQVKRAAFGAEGLVHDHYNRAALAVHLKEVGEKLLEAGGGLIRAVFCDSLEVFGSDWTPTLPQEFRRRRGYDLTPHLPVLLPGSQSTDAAAVRHDFGQTLTELFEEEFMVPLRDWCQRHKVQLRMQAYGIPPAGLSSYRYVDLPEGEGAQWNAFTATRWASSAAHWLGRPLTHSETWTWIHSPVFRATPLDFKAEADQHFLQGVTQLVGHGWPYSPEVVGKPGWRFYAAGVMNDHNPWWHVMPDLMNYLARISFMLRQGDPVNDIALYAPIHDAWASFTMGRISLFQAVGERIGPRLIPRLLEAGYNFDLVDDAVITDLAHIEKGRLIVARQAYSIVVLPNVERITAATLRRLRDFARAGGLVVATRRLPALAPGYLDKDRPAQEIAQLVRELFQAPDAPGLFLAEEDSGLAKALVQRRRPDVIFAPSSPQLGFVHRHSPAAEIYFVVNTGNRPVTASASFRLSGRRPEFWDPASGQITQVVGHRSTKTETVVELALAPYESRLIVFPTAPTAGAKPAPSPATSPLRELDLSADWEVTFEEDGRKTTMHALRSWTDDPATRYYSGRATYRRSFSLPPEFLSKNVRVKLDFGQGRPLQSGPARGFRAWLEAPVREAAEVFVNGRRAGSVWRPPYEVDVTGLLRPGENRLEIVVSNLMINRMAGEPLPDYSALKARYGDRFQPQDLENLQPLPCGLLGPIRLVAY